MAEGETDPKKGERLSRNYPKPWLVGSICKAASVQASEKKLSQPARRFSSNNPHSRAEKKQGRKPTAEQTKKYPWLTERKVIFKEIMELREDKLDGMWTISSRKYVHPKNLPFECTIRKCDDEGDFDHHISVIIDNIRIAYDGSYEKGNWYVHETFNIYRDQECMTGTGHHVLRGLANQFETSLNTFLTELNKHFDIPQSVLNYYKDSTVRKKTTVSKNVKA